MSDLIKQVGGLQKAKDIVNGAPEGATHIAGSAYLKLIGAVWWQAWQQEWSHDGNCMVRRWKGESIDLMKTWGKVFKLDNIRQAIADYNTDHCTSIENHISPSTVRIEK